MQQPIGASELIITEKGTIYHLDLRPDQIADTIITVGDPNRVASVSQYFDRIEHKAQHREFVTHTGYIGSKKISVVGTGIGPDNIDIVLNELDALANISFETRLPNEKSKSLKIIRMGTCGSLQPDVPVDSFVISTHGIGLDNLMHYYQMKNTENEKMILQSFAKHTGLFNQAVVPYIVEGNQSLRKTFELPQFTHGITVTCPGFYGPQGRVLRGPIAFPNLIDQLTSFKHDNHKITNFEMETSAIYGLGRLLGHECMSINTIVANRVHKTFSKDAATSIDAMIQQSLAIISTI